MNLEKQLALAKEKNRCAVERKKEKQKTTKNISEKNVPYELQKYFLSLLTSEQKEKVSSFDFTPYMFRFANDCKNVGISDFEKQKVVLNFFVENWDKLRKTMLDTKYSVMQSYPNPFDISENFFRCGLCSFGFGLNISKDKFKKEDE